MIFPLIDGYELQERIGEGGMGAVFLAKRETDGRIVAIKTIRHIFLSSGQAKGDLRFKREIEACKNFAHPYVVKLLDGGFLPKGESFIVMEYLKGTDLDGVARRKTLSEKQCRKIASEMAEALTYVHSANIIHRDVKPSNVFLEESGRTVLIDFGLALPTNLTRLTATNEIVGTPCCLAPEQIEGNELGPWTDIYGLGISLYFALMGEYPYSRELLHSILADDSEIELSVPRVENVSQRFASIIERCMDFDWKKRFQSGEELLAALNDEVDVVEVVAKEEEDNAETEGREKRPIILVALSLILLIIVFCALSAKRESKPIEEPRDYLEEIVPLRKSLLSSKEPLTAKECEVMGLVLLKSGRGPRLVKTTDVGPRVLGLYYLARIAQERQSLLLFEQLLKSYGPFCIEPKNESLLEETFQKYLAAKEPETFTELLKPYLDKEENDCQRDVLTYWHTLGRLRHFELEHPNDVREEPGEELESIFAVACQLAAKLEQGMSVGSPKEPINQRVVDLLINSASMTNTASSTERLRNILLSFVKRNPGNVDMQSALFDGAGVISHVNRKEIEKLRIMGQQNKSPNCRQHLKWSIELFRLAAQRAPTKVKQDLARASEAEMLAKLSHSKEALVILETIDGEQFKPDKQVYFYGRLARTYTDLNEFSKAYRASEMALRAASSMGEKADSLIELQEMIRIEAAAHGVRIK